MSEDHPYKETVISLKIKLFLYAILSAGTFALPILASLGVMMPPTEVEATWFQRSGSMMVITGALIEFRLFSIVGYIDPSGSSFMRPFNIPKSYEISYKLISTATLLSIIAGTIIWGYGDLII